MTARITDVGGRATRKKQLAVGRLLLGVSLRSTNSHLAPHSVCFRVVMSPDTRPTFTQSLLVRSAVDLQTLLILFIGRRSSGDLRRPPIFPYRHNKDAPSICARLQGSRRILWDIQGRRKCCGWERAWRYAISCCTSAQAEVVNSNSQLPHFSPAMRQ